MNKNLFAAIVVSFLAGMVTLSIAKAMSTSKNKDGVPIKSSFEVDPCKRVKIFDACMGGIKAHDKEWASQVAVCSPKAEREALVDMSKTTALP